MKYNEYKAPNGKVLFNPENFTYGNTILSRFELNFIVLDKEEAEALAEEYRLKDEALKKEQEEEIQKIEEELRQQQIEEVQPQINRAKTRSISEDSIQTMSLNEDGEYIEDESSEEVQENDFDKITNQKQKELEDFKRNHIASLLSRGVPFNNKDVTKIEHETQHI